ncbi:unnamed protein product, partial [Mesorhabditis belari]|uniref:Sodium/hydrogen exchanger n=1 Tax=Mesorhabditis belari TaxID=2138241 RepID=A0AAF3FDY7_9BILA
MIWQYLFFLYLLPPIALDAGYFLPNSAFFSNFWTIILYAVAGTIFNILTIGGTIWMFESWYDHHLGILDIMLFSTLISAVDPVAVLSVFEEIHVNQLLYICVFGESLLNDAVTIVLYHSFIGMVKIGTANIMITDFLMAFLSFLMVSMGGVLIGLVFVCITAIMTKLSVIVPVVQPLLCLVLPFLSYLIAESVHLSGILAIVTCGLLMKPYIAGNLNEQSLTTVRYFLKTITSSSEAIIFVFLGMSTFSKRHIWDILFTTITVIACILWRFVGVYLFTWIANKKRSDNGKEFAKRLVKELVNRWPSCRIVHGRPRHSQSQGSVGRANQDVEKILCTQLREQQSTRWARILPIVQSMKNQRYHRGIGRSPYEAMFGRKMQLGFLDTIALSNAERSIDDNEQDTIQHFFPETDDEEDAIAIAKEKEEDFVQRDKEIWHHRNGAALQQQKQAENRLEKSKNRFGAVEVGQTVRLPIDAVDRPKIGHSTLFGVVMEENQGFYQIGTTNGILQQKLTRNQFEPANNNFLSFEEVPQVTSIATSRMDV